MKTVEQKSRRAEVFTQHDMGEHLRALLLQACHKPVQEGTVSIHQLPSALGKLRESLGDRGVGSQHPGGSNGQMGRGGFR